MNPRMPGLELWFVTGSQHLYGPEVLDLVDEHARVDRERASTARRRSPSASCPSRSSAPPRGSRRCCARPTGDPACVGVIAWMHTFSPAKMWIAGLTDLRKPLVHLHTQFNRDLPWSSIDMDFMNLNQSAHGDREFAFIQTRLRRSRKTIVGHWQDPAVAARLGSWARAAVGWHEAHQLRIARFGDNMREVAVTEGDKVEAQARLGFSVNGFGVNDLVAAVEAVSETDVDDAHRRLRGGLRRRAGARCRRRRRHGELRDGGADRGGPADLPRGRRVRRVHRHVRGSRRARAAARHRRPAADGRRLRLRRGGRLEGRRAGPDPEGHGRGPAGRHLVHGGLHLPPRRPGPRGARARTCSRSARRSPRRRRRARSTRCPSAARATRSGSCSTPRPGPAVVVGLVDIGDRFRLIANEVDIVPPDAPLPKLPVARAVWRPRPDLATAAEAWLTAGGPHHTALTTALGLDEIARLRRDRRTSSSWPSTPRRRRASFANELRWNQAYYCAEPRAW